MAENKDKNREQDIKSAQGKKEESGSFPPGKGKLNPKTVVNNPDMQYSGRSTDYQNIREVGNSAGSPESQSKDLEGNYEHLPDEQDFNKSGHVIPEQNEQFKKGLYGKTGAAYGGKEGKTMVKNSETSDYKSTDRQQGQQQGGNHGGSAAANKKYGNQDELNSQREKQQNSDGDYKGQKGKK